MGSIGNTTLNKYPSLPQRIKYVKNGEIYYIQDASKDRFSSEAYTGYTIERIFWGGYHGRGTGSTQYAYTVNYKSENLVEGNVPGRRALDTLKEAKEFLNSQKWRK